MARCVLVPKEQRYRFQQAFMRAYADGNVDAALAALAVIRESCPEIAQDPILLYVPFERSVAANIRHLVKIKFSDNAEWGMVDAILREEFGVSCEPPMALPESSEIDQFNNWQTDFPTFAAIYFAQNEALTPAHTAARYRATAAKCG